MKICQFMNKTRKQLQKDYNRMINSLKFGLFKRCLLSKAAKKGVLYIIKPILQVNSTEKLLQNRMKLNVHDIALMCFWRFYQYD